VSSAHKPSPRREESSGEAGEEESEAGGHAVTTWVKPLALPCLAEPCHASPCLAAPHSRRPQRPGLRPQLFPHLLHLPPPLRNLPPVLLKLPFQPEGIAADAVQVAVAGFLEEKLQGGELGFDGFGEHQFTVIASALRPGAPAAEPPAAPKRRVLG